MPALPTVEVLRDDYSRTLDVFKALVDIRFRLLALVPAVAGVAVGLLGKPDVRGTTVAVAALGLVATAGVIVYEIRNSQLHDSVVHRLKFLGMPPARPHLIGRLPPTKDPVLAFRHTDRLAYSSVHAIRQRPLR